MRGQNIKIPRVLDDKARHGGINGRGVNPIDRVHFFNERRLSNDSSDQIEAKTRRVVPVSRHHPPDCDPLPSLQLGSQIRSGSVEEQTITQTLFDLRPNVTDRWGFGLTNVGTLEQTGREAVFEETIWK